MNFSNHEISESLEFLRIFSFYSIFYYCKIRTKTISKILMVKVSQQISRCPSLMYPKYQTIFGYAAPGALSPEPVDGF